MAKTHIPVSGSFPNGYDQPGVYEASCELHRWTVIDSFPAVQALVREHVREHPSVHCPSPPPIGSAPAGNVRFVRYKITHVVRHDGSSVYSGTCGKCPSQWSVFYSPEPVEDIMRQHWADAHADDYAQEQPRG